MDIAPAYPAAAHAKSWGRTVRLNRGRDVEITEAFELTSDGGNDAQFSYPARCRDKPARRSKLERGWGAPRVKMRLEYDAAKLTANR